MLAQETRRLASGIQRKKDRRQLSRQRRDKASRGKPSSRFIRV